MPLVFMTSGLRADANSGVTSSVTATSTAPTGPAGRASGEAATGVPSGQPATGVSSSQPVTGSPSGAAVTGATSGQPITGQSVAGNPPEPSPLAPLAAPGVQGDPAPPQLPAAGQTESAAQLAISGAALAPPVMPAAPPPDVVDDSQPITGSVFDQEDNLNRHPVNSARAITGSTFDREDRVDEHPVP